LFLFSYYVVWSTSVWRRDGARKPHFLCRERTETASIVQQLPLESEATTQYVAVASSKAEFPNNDVKRQSVFHQLYYHEAHNTQAKPKKKKTLDFVQTHTSHTQIHAEKRFRDWQTHTRKKISYFLARKIGEFWHGASYLQTEYLYNKFKVEWQENREDHTLGTSVTGVRHDGIHDIFFYT
jgi:hypothetical protein